MKTLERSDTIGRDNNLTLVRLVAALAVIWGHSFALVHVRGQDPFAIWTNGHTYSGTIAVSAFFALSGFLVTRSFWFKPWLGNWLKQRVARIYPGLWVSIVVMLVYVFVVYRRSDGVGFFISPEVLDFASHNATLETVRFFIDGAFPDNKMPNSLNGSWWTLPGEMRVYLLFFVIALFALAPHRNSRFLEIRRGLFVCLAAGLIGYSYYNHPAMPIIMDHQSYASPTRYFLLGCIAFYLRAYIPLTGWLCLVLLALPFLVAYQNKEIFLFLFMFGTCHLVF
ncbi:MAG: acyltransferase [Rhodobacteraceae bacterium]|nr:acyltransferase [Paracoccaceae bacterium]